MFEGLTEQEKYKQIIEAGKNLADMEESLKIDGNIVPGCQSIVYLHSECVDGKMFFKASSDALISKGLAALLINFFNGKSPEEVVREKPFFLKDLQMGTTLSPGRSNGLQSMLLRMQRDAVKFLVRV